MKTIFFLLFAMPSVWASSITCSYTGNKFRIHLNDKKYEHLASPGFADPAISCGWDLAALYDGFDLIVFRSKYQDFVIQKVADHYYGAQLKGRGEFLGFYDGEDLTTFDGQRFTQHSANPNFYRSQLVVSEKLIAFYDGKEVHFVDKSRGRKTQIANPLYLYPEGKINDRLAVLYDGHELHLFDAAGSELFRETLASRSIYFEAALAKDRALIYDGKAFLTYCSGKGFYTENAPSNIFVSSGYDVSRDLLWMRMGDTLVRLKPDCKIERRRRP